MRKAAFVLAAEAYKEAESRLEEEREILRENEIKVLDASKKKENMETRARRA
jgi:hypothetical protein